MNLLAELSTVEKQGSAIVIVSVAVSLACWAVYFIRNRRKR